MTVLALTFRVQRQLSFSIKTWTGRQRFLLGVYDLSESDSNNTEPKNFAPAFADDGRSPCSLVDLMTLFGRLSSFFRNSGSRGGSECNVMPTYSKSVASIACVSFTGPCALSKDLRSRCEVVSTQPFALTWLGCPHCHAPAADRSIGKTIKCHFRKQPNQSPKCSTR